MRRRVIRVSEPPQAPAPIGPGFLAAHVAETEPLVAKKRMPRGTYASAFDVAVADAESRAKTGDWSNAKGTTLVGLYAWCHRRVYGVEASELRKEPSFREAAAAAARLLHNECGDDADLVAELIRWTWDKEKRGEAAAAAKGEVREFRVTWRYQFSVRLLTSYRVELKRRERGGVALR